MRTIQGKYIEPLSEKQWIQLYKYCREFQPYTNTAEVVFERVITAAREFCDKSVYPFRGATARERFDVFLINDLIKRIKSKYFFNGIKYRNGELKDGQIRLIRWYLEYPVVRIKKLGYVNQYDSTERDLFMKTVRACRDFMREKMSRDAENAFYEKLLKVYEAL